MKTKEVKQVENRRKTGQSRMIKSKNIPSCFCRVRIYLVKRLKKSPGGGTYLKRRCSYSSKTGRSNSD